MYYLERKQAFAAFAPFVVTIAVRHGIGLTIQDAIARRGEPMREAAEAVREVAGVMKEPAEP